MTHPTHTLARQPLFAMAAAYFMLLLAAFGTSSLWPVYITQLGGGPTASGIFNAAGNLTGVAGTLLSGWLADRTGRRKTIFYVSSVLFAGTWWLMTRATTWQQLALINLAGGFTFCIALNMIVILTGLLAGKLERGRSFGVLTLTIGAAQLLGGLVCGPIADRFGFNTLFMVNTLLCVGCVLPGLFFVEPLAATPVGQGAGKTRRRGDTETGSFDFAQSARQGAGGRGGLGSLGRGFYLVVAASLLIGMAGFGGGLGRSIVMDQLGFSATAISLAAAVGAAIGLPIPLVMGWLSDRIGRKRLLVGCLTAGLTGLLGLAFAGSAWSFWGASVLLALLFSASPLLQALATDLLPAESVGSGLSLLSSASSAGLFISSLGIGAAIEGWGGRPAFLITALAPLIAMGLVAAVREIRVEDSRLRMKG